MRTNPIAAAACCLVLATAAWAETSVPIPVSPGSNDQDQIVRVAERCPTFTWSLVEDARSYDLVVYEVPARATDPREEPLFRVTLPGTASAWTPSLEHCLSAGERYAWSLRARGQRGVSAWSAPTLLEVRKGPSQSEVEEALQVLERYLEEARGSAAANVDAGLISRLLAESEDAQGRDRPLADAPAVEAQATRFKYGISAEEPDTGNTDIGAIAIRGTSFGTPGGSAGVWGESLALSGDVAGVKGTSLSLGGWGGHFQNYFPLGRGLFAGGGPGVGDPPVLAPDLVLGGSGDIGGGVLDDKGTIFSDPRFPSSDLILFSNNEVRLHLNLDGDEEVRGSWFRIYDGLDPIFQVQHTGDAFVRRHLSVTGDTTVSGNLTVSGSLGGTLVDLEDITSATEAAIVAHESQHHPKRVFVTSTTYRGGEFGGNSGANSRCQQLASGAGMYGEFLAWFGSPASSFNRSNGPYIRTDGLRVANNWADLVACAGGTCLDRTISVTETGATVSAAYPRVWTGALANGQPAPSGSPYNAQSCNGWTNSTSGGGWAGVWGETDSDWSGDAITSGNQPCHIPAHLYCFEQ